MDLVIIVHERGIPSKRDSSNRADYVPALCTHRPSLVPIEWSGEDLGRPDVYDLFGGQRWLELVQTVLFRGTKSRNKVSVGEPAEGSLTQLSIFNRGCYSFDWSIINDSKIRLGHLLKTSYEYIEVEVFHSIISLYNLYSDDYILSRMWLTLLVDISIK